MGVVLGPNAIALGNMSLRTLGDLAELSGTIRRMLGTLSIIPNAAGSAQLGIGVTVMTRDAADAGAASAPMPLGTGTSNRQGWYYWSTDTMVFPNSTTQKSFDFDIRSARRVRAGFTLGLVFESGTYSGPTTLTLNWQSRNLWSPEG